MLKAVGARREIYLLCAGVSYRRRLLCYTLWGCRQAPPLVLILFNNIPEKLTGALQLGNRAKDAGDSSEGRQPLHPPTRYVWI